MLPGVEIVDCVLAVVTPFSGSVCPLRLVNIRPSSPSTPSSPAPPQIQSLPQPPTMSSSPLSPKATSLPPPR